MSAVSSWFKDRYSQFTHLSTFKKSLCVVGFFAGVQLLLYINHHFNSHKDETEQVIERDVHSYHKDLPLTQGEYSTIDDENPLMAKTKDVLESFVEKLTKDNLLGKFFDKGQLVEGSLFLKSLQNQFLMSMGGPYIDDIRNVIELGLKNKGQKISHEHYQRWCSLWRQTLAEFNVQDKSVWDDFPLDLFEEQEK